MTKTLNLNQNICFFLHQNQNIFFSNIGNQNIFLEKKHNPPFKLNGRSLRELTEYEKVNVSNDLIKAEREKVKTMARSKKQQQLNDKSGVYIYKVRGPPWARRVMKLKKPDI
jgi:hypothetical protein